jgi:hypothetical protein
MFNTADVHHTQERGTQSVHRNSDTDTSRWMMMFVTRACHRCAYVKRIYLGQAARLWLYYFCFIITAIKCSCQQPYRPIMIEEWVFIYLSEHAYLKWIRMIANVSLVLMHRGIQCRSLRLASFSFVTACAACPTMGNFCYEVSDFRVIHKYKYFETLRLTYTCQQNMHA